MNKPNCKCRSILIILIRATAISEDQARDALLAFVAENCCYGKKAAKDMDIKDIAQSSAYHVSAEIMFTIRLSWENLSRNHNTSTEVIIPNPLFPRSLTF